MQVRIGQLLVLAALTGTVCLSPAPAAAASARPAAEGPAGQPAPWAPLYLLLAGLGTAVAVHAACGKPEGDLPPELARATVNAASDSIFWIRPDGGFSYVNDTACRRLGYGRAELLEMHVADIDPDYPRAKRPAQWERVKREGAVTFETRHCTRDGRVFPVEVTANYVAFGDRQYEVAFAWDITERREAEQERDRHLHDLAERNKELRCLYDVSQITADPDVPLDRMLQEVVDRIPPAWQYPEATCARIVLDGRAFRSPTFRQTPRAQAADITVADRKRGTIEVGLLEERPEMDEGPFLREERNLIEDLARRLGDTVERREAEQAVRENEERFRRAVTESPFPVMLHAEDGEVLAVNRAWTELTGYARDDIPTTAEWAEKAYGERKESIRADIDRLYHLDRHIDEGEYTVTCRDGTKRVWDFSSASLPPLPDGRRLVISMASDITVRKQAEEEVRRLADQLGDRVRRRTAELAAANAELEAFAYSVSHDLRAPLRTMDGFSEALLSDYGQVLDETGLDYLRRVRAGAQRMGRLIDDLLALSRATRAEMACRRVDLTRLAGEVLANLREAEPDRPVETDVQEGLAAEGDPRLLRQALQNLLENAWKFTRDARPARIAFRQLSPGEAAAAGADGEAPFVVRDNGVGFDPRYAHKLFQVFQRLHGRDEFPGTGVGLATVQRIIHRHGGRVWAEGRPGRGAAFYFTLT